jgi:hypothetical protein
MKKKPERREAELKAELALLWHFVTLKVMAGPRSKIREDRSHFLIASSSTTVSN